MTLIKIKKKKNIVTFAINTDTLPMNVFLNPRRKDRRNNKNPSNENIRHQERSSTSRNNSKNQNYRSNNLEGIKNTTDLEDSDCNESVNKKQIITIKKKALQFKQIKLK